MSQSYFIAGTDTGVGKTLVAAGLLLAAKAQGFTSFGLKPVAAGAIESEPGSEKVMVNEDALLLQQCSTLAMPYAQVNPVLLAEPMAPHIAAEREGKRITLDRLVGLCRGALMQSADLKLVEGAGGWRVPINPREMLSGLPQALNLPVILVVGMRLGCLNHALLTVEAIRRDGVPIAGWIANQIDPDMPVYEENVQTLKNLIPAPLLASLTHINEASAEKLASQLDAGVILELCKK